MLALFLCVLASVPILSIYFSFTSINIQNWQHLIDNVLSEYIINSAVLMIGVGLLSACIGSLLAWIVVRYDFYGRSACQWLILLPLAMPAYIIAYAYTGMFDFAGPVQTYLRDIFEWSANDYYFPEVRSMGGAISLMALVLYPYVYLMARVAFQSQSTSLEEVSMVAGKTAFQHFVSVSLPLALPAILLGAILTMMEALADFGTVQYFGVPTLTTGIYRTWFGMGDISTASQLSALLCTLVFVLLYLEFSSRKTSQAYQGKQSLKRSLIKVRPVKAICLLSVCLLPVCLGFLVPFVQLFSWSLSYTQDASLEEFIGLGINSLMLAFLGAAFIVLFALIVSYSKRRFPSKRMNVSSRFVSLGYAMPGTVIAVGVLVPMGWLDMQINHLTQMLTGATVGLVFSGTIFILIFAYLVRFASIAIQHTDSGLQRIPTSIDEVALSLSKTPRHTFFNIHLPLIRASVLSATLLVFVDILKELPATLVLRPFDFNTLAVKTFELASDERLIAASLPAISIVVVGILPVVLLTKTLDKKDY